MANSCLDNGVGNSMYWADTRSIFLVVLVIRRRWRLYSRNSSLLYKFVHYSRTACNDGVRMFVSCQDRDRFVIQMLNGIGDLLDLRYVLSRHLRPNFHRMSLEQVKQYIAFNGHCSVLVKVGTPSTALYRLTALALLVL